MTDINHFVLVGRVTKSISEDERAFSYVGNGTAKATVPIAVNRSVKKGDEWIDEVSFFDVVIWGKLAENLKPKLNKGVQVVVSGCLKQDRWEKDGQKFSKVTLVADSVQLLSNSKKDGETNDSSQAPAFKPINNNSGNNEFEEEIPW